MGVLLPRGEVQDVRDFAGRKQVASGDGQKGISRRYRYSPGRGTGADALSPRSLSRREIRSRFPFLPRQGTVSLLIRCRSRHAITAFVSCGKDVTSACLAMAVALFSVFCYLQQWQLYGSRPSYCSSMPYAAAPASPRPGTTPSPCVPAAAAALVEPDRQGGRKRDSAWRCKLYSGSASWARTSSRAAPVTGTSCIAWCISRARVASSSTGKNCAGRRKRSHRLTAAGYAVESAAVRSSGPRSANTSRCRTWPRSPPPGSVRGA